MGTMLKVKAREDRVASMLIKNDSRTSNVASFFDPPKSNVFLSTAYHSVVVNRAELEAQNIKVRSLTSKYLGLLISVDSRDVPHNDKFLVVSIFANASKESAIWGERKALHGHNRHGKH